MIKAANRFCLSLLLASDSCFTSSFIIPRSSLKLYSLLRANACFTSPDTLDVDGRRLTARRIVIAAGSRARVPDIPGLSAVPYLTHAELFDRGERPDHLLIIGGGPIGLEMAQAYAGLSCRVTVVQRGRLAPRSEPAAPLWH